MTSYVPLTATQPATLPTYGVQAAVIGPSGGGPGGTNKAMVSIFNPDASGKIARVRSLLVQAESSSGTGVIVLYELRRISAHSAGALYTPRKWDTTNPNAVVVARTAPDVTEIADPTVYSLILQANTAQSLPMLRFGGDNAESLTLQANEGLVVHQVTSNGGTFQINLVWTEE